MGLRVKQGVGLSRVWSLLASLLQQVALRSPSPAASGRCGDLRSSLPSAL